ncbi:MAG: DUF5063 domain-containing protein [Bacteroidales bacterium]|jgi:hypothetical protein|nr:DUF5063 domain-containing protein [Bacteroidales bacterium]
MTNHSILYKKESIEFVAVAKEYLVLLENAKEFQKNDFITNSLKMLSLLYHKVLFVAKIEHCDSNNDCDNAFIEKFVNEVHWSYFQNVISEILDEDDVFVQLQDNNIISDSDYMNVPLSELYADLYQEMGDLIGAYKTENEELMIAALNECHENFYSYWGIRTLILLQNLNNLNTKLLSDEV